jgi:hypothetical protein
MRFPLSSAPLEHNMSAPCSYDEAPPVPLVLQNGRPVPSRKLDRRERLREAPTPHGPAHQSILPDDLVQLAFLSTRLRLLFFSADFRPSERIVVKSGRSKYSLWMNLWLSCAVPTTNPFPQI